MFIEISVDHMIKASRGHNGSIKLDGCPSASEISVKKKINQEKNASNIGQFPKHNKI